MKFGIHSEADCSPEERGSAQRRVAHAKASAHVFGEQFNGGAVGYRVRLRQILHGFDQSFLAIDVTWIARPFSFPTTDIGNYWNRENFGHEQFT
jgi:hypothetical protein